MLQNVDPLPRTNGANKSVGLMAHLSQQLESVTSEIQGLVFLLKFKQEPQYQKTVRSSIL